jgi:signal peptidase I
MEPTYAIGERVNVRSGSARVGVVVVFHPPKGALEEQCGPKAHRVRTAGRACDSPVPEEDTEITLIKRIVAGPGDELEIRGGHVSRRAAGEGRFAPEADPYIRPCAGGEECSFPTPIKVPPGHWFLMGDNRGESDDSRFWGPVPTAWITGIVTGVAMGPQQPAEGSEVEGGFPIESRGRRQAPVLGPLSRPGRRGERMP